MKGTLLVFYLLKHLQNNDTFRVIKSRVDVFCYRANSLIYIMDIKLI